MNLSLADIRSAVLAVSQFTLYGDVRRGRHPSFDEAAPPELARELYEYFVRKIREAGVVCEIGRFQAMMQVELVNDGPVTILLDSTRSFGGIGENPHRQRQPGRARVPLVPTNGKMKTGLQPVRVASSIHCPSRFVLAIGPDCTPLLPSACGACFLRINPRVYALIQHI